MTKTRKGNQFEAKNNPSHRRYLLDRTTEIMLTTTTPLALKAGACNNGRNGKLHTPHHSEKLNKNTTTRALKPQIVSSNSVHSIYS